MLLDLLYFLLVISVEVFNFKGKEDCEEDKHYDQDDVLVQQRNELHHYNSQSRPKAHTRNQYEYYVVVYQ